MNKRGIHPGFWVLIVMVVLAALIIFWPSIRGSVASVDSISAELADSQPIGDVIEEPSFNFVSYIVGNVPSLLVDYTNPISAVIVMLALFTVIFFIFTDIIKLFGTFDNPAIAWVAGAALAIIAVNLKLTAWILVIGFALTSGIGVFAAIVGIGMPFVIFLVIHLVFFKNLQGWARGKKTASEFKAGVDDMKQGIRAAKEFGKEVRSK